MKQVIWSLIASAACAAVAMPSVSGIRFTRDAKSAQIRVDYTVVGEPAVVTASFKSNGTPIAENLYTNLSGAVNCLVQPGSHRFMLQPGVDWTFSDRDVEVAVRAWATNSPPNYIVFDLPSRGAIPPKYYVSTNAFPAPLSDIRYRTTQLVMRRIPAANVEFRMGAPTDEVGSEMEGGGAIRAASSLRGPIGPFSPKTTIWVSIPSPMHSRRMPWGTSPAVSGACQTTRMSDRVIGP